MIRKEPKKKKINWNAFRKKCPECKSTELERINKYKKSYEKIRNEWKVKELRLYKCKICGYEFWE